MNKFTSLHHLNLFIHMGMDYPITSEVYPYFYQKGYRIKFISFLLQVPKLTKDKIQKQINTSINANVVPELIYENIETRELILLECKLLDIKYDPTNRDVKQAFGYLSLNDKEIFEYMGGIGEQNKSKLFYSVLHENQSSYEEVLNTIAGIVKNTASDHLPFEVSGIKVNGNEIDLCLKNSETGDIEEHHITSDPLLLIIPIDPEVNLKNEYGREVLEQNLKMTIATKICPFVGYKNIQFSLEDVCEEIIPVWRLWSKHPKTKIRELIKYYMRQLSKELEKIGLKIILDRGVYQIEKTDLKIGEKVRNFFRFNSSEYIEKDSLDSFEQMVIEEWIGEI
ncbi:hypothetical protein Q9R46_14435 [Paenibacillus sp. RRE4]|uniref:hypothetical protein n=1 Tax=Paenibacillus sp. RRE4 TaxID=2962587 RepID=UPI002882A959|nr:hypothetical protein [Paenibacillus sp. RRE4]MDT0123855.1 hypothetical protein [Paenibacillus sp. RRE4]